MDKKNSSSASLLQFMKNPPAAKPIFLVSACLLGFCSRYDGKIKPNEDCIHFLTESIIIPVCPEQSGGLSTPRPAADIINGDGYDVLKGNARVCTKNGKDVTAAFVSGAKQVLQLAKLQPINGICLKARSPSCSITGTIGVTAALLSKNNFRLYEF